MSFLLSNEIRSSAGAEGFSLKALVQLSWTSKAVPRLSQEPTSQGAWSMPCTDTHVDVLQIMAMVPLLLFLGDSLRARVANVCLYCLSQFKKDILWIYMLCFLCPKGCQATLEMPGVCGSAQWCSCFHPTDSALREGNEMSLDKGRLFPRAGPALPPRHCQSGAPRSWGLPCDGDPWILSCQGEMSSSGQHSPTCS